MNKLLRIIYNMIVYCKITDCPHNNWEPVDMVDYKCDACGIVKGGINPNKKKRS